MASVKFYTPIQANVKWANIDDFYKIRCLQLGLHALDLGYIVYGNYEKNSTTPI